MKLSKEEAQKRIKVVEEALAAGHYPYQWVGPRERGWVSAIVISAQKLGLTASTLTEQVRPGGEFEIKHKLSVNWSLFKQKPLPEVTGTSPEERMLTSLKLEVERLRREANVLRQDRWRVYEELVATRRIREDVLNLTDPPLRPKLVSYKRPPGLKHSHIVLLHLSDFHCGEVVELDQVNGLNRYDSKLFEVRLARFFNKAVSLLTEHWSSGKIERIIVLLGGDLVTGEIHEELAKTNDEYVPETVRRVGEALAGGLALLRSKLKVPVDVHTTPGNHGRLTRKLEAKGFAANSWDTLSAYFAEAALKDSDVAWSYPPSGEALMKIFDYNVLGLHGHNLGGGQSAGTGVYGPIYAMVRGMWKTRQSYLDRGIRLHYQLICHYHTTVVMPLGAANGSLIGPSEYGMNTLKILPEPAQQNLIVFHPENFIVDHKKIFVGAPDEGSIYTSES